jgi:Gluconate 2-dehydrogenase subunit 3
MSPKKLPALQISELVQLALSFRVMRIFGHEGPHSSPRPSASSLFNRRDLIRAALFAGAASALGPRFSVAQAVSSGLTAAAKGEDGSTALTDPNWRAAFLNDHQNQTLIVLSDVIIPATDTPGAKEALVNRYLDLLLSVQPAEFQRNFVDALAYIDTESQKQFGKDFRGLGADEQIWLLTPWAFARQPSHWTARNETRIATPDLGQQHFELLKALIATAYYESEIGQKELGWDGEFTHGPYEGCEHPTTAHT